MSKVHSKKETDMKTVIATMMSLSLMVVLGCQSPRGGGMSGDEGFKIGTPTFTTKIKQGDTESVTVSVNRGKQFKRDVTLDISTSKGISVEPAHVLVRGSEKPDVALRIAASKDADLGEYKIFVTGTPEIGEATSTELKVMVVAP